MTLRAYFKLVEIQTKVASLFPFAIATVYTLYRYGYLNRGNLLLMLLSLLLLDMATTAINNYMDHRNAVRKHGYGYEAHNAMARYDIPPAHARWTIFLLLFGSMLLGLWLVSRTDYIVLLVGIIAFAVGITYSFGPVPVSRTPFGEAVSGVTMGLGIFFLACYIHIHDLDILVVAVQDSILAIGMDWRELLALGIMALPGICGIAGIMLANNICDLEDDLENRRYTLVAYIGVKRSLDLLLALYALAFLSILAAVLLGIVPFYYLLAMLAAIPITKKLRTFRAEPRKDKTFVLSVQSFVLLETVCLILLVVAVLLPGWGRWTIFSLRL